jgi:RNA polymerase sigma-70 factor (ECF subfamily)
MEAVTDKNGDPQGELALVCEARQGSVDAFSTLVETYKRRAYFAALALVRNHDDALELSQEAFARAFKAMNRFDETRPFYPWLYKIVRNLCLNHLKRRTRHQEVSIDIVESRTGEGLSSAQAGPAEIAERNETKERLWKAIGQLSPDHREIIVLRHFQEMSYAEIAEALDCPKGTVMSRLHAARRSLRDQLDRHE